MNGMWWRRIWHLLSRPRHERELVREMSEHRESMHDPTKFGDTHRLLERSRDAWGWNWLDDAMQDLTVGVRTLVKSPSFAITATLILTFGIGLNVTLFQMMRVGLLRPPALKNVDSLVRFLRSAPDSTTSAVPYPLAQFIEGNNTALAAVLLETSATMAWGRDAGEEVHASFVSANWFDELGYGPLHGRMLSESLDARAEIPSVILSFTFWQNRLGANPNLIGTTVYIDRKPVIIAGIAQAKFPGLDFNVPDVFVPIAQREYFYPESTMLRAWGEGTVDMYGRLRDGVSPAAAREVLRSTMQAIAAQRPEVKRDEWLEPLLARDNFMRPGERTAVLAVVSLMGSLTGLVLIVAAANLGNLVMSRATGRVRELGVRMALGARRSRIVRQLVIENGAAGGSWRRREPGVRVGDVNSDRGARRLSAVPGFPHRVADRRGCRRARHRVSRGGRTVAGLEGRATALDRGDQRRRAARVAHARSVETAARHGGLTGRRQLPAVDRRRHDDPEHAARGRLQLDVRLRARRGAVDPARTLRHQGRRRASPRSS